MANCVASVADLFHRTERGKYQGLVGTAFGIPSVAGPVVGGYVTDHFAWNWVFLINVPAGIVVLLMLLRFPGTDADTQNMRLDHLGMATLTLAVVPSMFAFSWAGAHHAWGSSQVVASLATGLAMAGVFVYVESKADHPIMPLAIYRNRTVIVCVLIIALTGFGLDVSIVLMPLFFQGALGASASGSGKFRSAIRQEPARSAISPGLTHHVSDPPMPN